MRWLLVFLMGSCMAFGESIRGVVINVIDGDTITLLEKRPNRSGPTGYGLKGLIRRKGGKTGMKAPRSIWKS